MKISGIIITGIMGLMLLQMPKVMVAQIIANHTVVDDFEKIPQEYIDEVKKMWVILAGESHSKGYRIGCQLLENSFPQFQVNIKDSGTPEGYTDAYLRLSRATWGDVQTASGWIYNYGEEDWFTSVTAISRTKDHLTYCNTNNLPIAAMGFGWCWDMTANNWPGGTVDPHFQVRWAGRTDGGPEGSLRWGLNNEDNVLTGNSVNMDTYLNATIEYINHCQTNEFPTKMFFTTGPVDGNGNVSENGYQRSVKHQYIRDFVAASSGRLLFDYADILCWSNSGEQQLTNWTDFAGIRQSYQVIHDDNMLDLDGSYTEDGDHIGQRGALRLAKAFWWMLARMAGWDGNTLGIDQPGNEFPIQIYPNPAGDKLTIELSNSAGGSYYISDFNGKKFLQRDIIASITEVDISSLSKGVYIVGLQHNQNNAFRRFIKQ
ncbi:MAG: T9SS type A sorting domain-containing protein [Bacteroidota bacterium]